MIAGNTNWLDEISQLGIQNNHQVTISGGNDKAATLLSLNFLQNQGTQIYTGFKRFSVRLNTDYHVLNNHLTIGENLEASHLKDNNQNAMHEALVEPPIIPVHSTDGGWGGSAVALGMDDYWNPVRDLTLNKGNGTRFNKVFGDVHANLMFLNHFTLHSQLGLIYTEGDHRTIQSTFKEAGGKFNPISSVDQWPWQEATLDLTNTLDYKLNTGKHDLDFLAGMAANTYTTETTDGRRQDIQFQNYNYAYLNTGTGNIEVQGSGDKFNLLSYFSKFNDIYNSKYLLSASLRYDGSSKFGKPFNKIATTNYFGDIPAGRLKHTNDMLFFKADGKSRGKLGIEPGHAKPLAGSYDPQHKVLTIIMFDLDSSAKYLNQEWNTDKPTFSGDAVNAYNDGPLADGTQMGPFYEIESVSPAAFLKPGESLSHKHTVFHFTGDGKGLDTIAQKLLGVSLTDIQKEF